MKKIIQILILCLITLLPWSTGAVSSVTLLGATNISSSSATLNGVVTSVDGIGWWVFEYSTENASSCEDLNGFTAGGGSISTGTGVPTDYEVFATASGLEPSTTYYYCLWATSSSGTAYSSIDSFTTAGVVDPPGQGDGPEANPDFLETPLTKITHCNDDDHTICARVVNEVVVTQASVTDTTAVLQSEVEGPATHSYMRYSPLDKPPVFCNDVFGSQMKVTPDMAGGGGTITIVGLRPGTRYYYCAIASNSEEISHGFKGHVKYFDTKPCETCPQTEVDTYPAIVLSPFSATLRGEYGTTKIATTWFEYREAEGFSGGGWIPVGEEVRAPNTYSKFNYLLKDLEDDTEYLFRAVAESEDGLFYGDTLSFKTFTEDEFGDFGGWIYAGNPQLECAQGVDTPGCDDDLGGGGNVPQECPAGYTGTYPNCTLIVQECAQNPDAPECNSNTGGGGEEEEEEEEEEECPFGDYNGDEPGCGAEDEEEFCEENPNDPFCDLPDLQDIPGGSVITINLGDLSLGGGGGGGYGGAGNLNLTNLPPINPNSIDLDGDGTSNLADIDSDGDGVLNILDTDDDNDGIPDAFDPTPLGPGSTGGDLDGDGIPNSIDNDDDNDGIPDNLDPTPFGTGSDPNDLDGDGINNLADDDTDGDGIPNDQDPDDDNDGIPDEFDPTPRGAGTGEGNDLGKDSSGEVKGESVEEVDTAGLEEASTYFETNPEVKGVETTDMESKKNSKRFLGKLVDKVLQLFKR